MGKCMKNEIKAITIRSLILSILVIRAPDARGEPNLRNINASEFASIKQTVNILNQ